MRDGFVRVAVGTPKIRPADCFYNAEQAFLLIQRAEAEQAKVLVLPELCISGYSCKDLFLQDSLIRAAREALLSLAERTLGFDVLAVVGLPMEKDGKLYNAAAAVQNGRILGIAAKTRLMNYAEGAELRYFSVPQQEDTTLVLDDKELPFGTGLLFCATECPKLVLGIELCEELWVPDAVSVGLAMAGATVIANPSAGCALAGRGAERRDRVKGQSLQLKAGYLYANAGQGESSTDLVFSGQGFIAENGTVLSEGIPFETEYLSTELDLEMLWNERRRMSTWNVRTKGYQTISYSLPKLSGKPLPVLSLQRTIQRTPFFPEKKENRSAFFREVIAIQCAGLRQRLSAIGIEKAVIGISGGLDSTLALLVTAKTFAQCGYALNGILAVTMPCFGTTDRTYQNALTLARELGVTLREIRIEEAVRLHLRDIGHDINRNDVTYENAQARERTQVLMDLANEVGGIVIGTGDLSELALGFATYNGDHMSMYGLNSSVPKTLVRELVSEFAKRSTSKTLADVLNDILFTPISPELLPPHRGEPVQKTEALIGPYELHDFFLYYVVNFGFSPTKIYRLATEAFRGEYEGETILTWMKLFYRRFFSQQYKRSCMPDGPKTGAISLSPRGDFCMPSDACAALWLSELDGMGSDRYA